MPFPIFQIPSPLRSRAATKGMMMINSQQWNCRTQVFSFPLRPGFYIRIHIYPPNLINFKFKRKFMNDSTWAKSYKKDLARYTLLTPWNHHQEGKSPRSHHITNSDPFIFIFTFFFYIYYFNEAYIGDCRQ